MAENPQHPEENLNSGTSKEALKFVENPAAGSGLRKRMFKIILLLIVIFVGYALVIRNISFIGGFPIFNFLKKDKAADRVGIEDIAVPVKAYRTAIMDFTDNLPALGSIKGYHQIDLKFAESGYIEYINFKDGEKVIEGDIIASLDQREALLKLEYSKNEMEKNQMLYDLGSVIELKLNQAKLEYQSARLEYERSNLVAVYDGYIGSIGVERGAFVTPNDIIGSFVNLSDAYAEFGVIEKDVSKVRIGMPATMVVDSYPRDTFNGEIESISPIVEGKSRTFKVKARVTNEDEKLKAGMFGRVAIQIYEKQNALVIPGAALKKKGEEYFVYVIHPESNEKDVKGPKVTSEKDAATQEQEIIFGTVEIRPIQVAYTTPDAVEIKSGLDEQELIVADVQQEMEEKTRVEVTEVQENIF